MVQVIPREIEDSRNWMRLILPWFSLILAITIIIGVFFLSARTKTQNDRFADLEEQLKAEQTEETKQLEQDLMLYKKKVINVIQILGDRQLAFPFYSFLEGLVHPKIYFTSASLDMVNGQATLKGISQDFQSLGQQVDIFKKDDFIQNADVKSISLAEQGGIEFVAELSFLEPETKQ